MKRAFRFFLLVLVVLGASLGAVSLAGFMNFAASKLAREVARLHEWPDKVWSPRRAIFLHA